MVSDPAEEGEPLTYKGYRYRLRTSEFMIVRHFALLYPHMSREGRHIIEDVLRTTCGRNNAVLFPYILRGVTEPQCYCHTLIMSGMPCGKDLYYELRRHFYFELWRRLKAVINI